jgi:hypothetical protein
VKPQHKCIIDFAKSFSDETRTLEQVGPVAQKQLEHIAETIQAQVHKVELVQSGTTFMFAKSASVAEQRDWVEKAVAFSRLMIDEKSLMTQISSNTVLNLSNIYATAFWLPMRSHSPPHRVSLLDKVSLAYRLSTPKSSKSKLQTDGQLSFFQKEVDDDFNE